jgi:hypothetical protein
VATLVRASTSGEPDGDPVAVAPKVADGDGGGVAEAGDALLATIRQTVYRRSLPLATRSLGIHRSMLGWQAGVVGAATMVANELFAPDFLPRWLDAGAPVAAYA